MQRAVKQRSSGRSQKDIFFIAKARKKRHTYIWLFNGMQPPLDNEMGYVHKCFNSIKLLGSFAIVISEI